METLKFRGTIIDIGNVQKVSEKFEKQNFVVEDKDSRYPQTIEFQVANRGLALLDGFGVGSLVDVSFNLNGRRWKNPQGEIKTFNTLEAWRISAVQVAGAPTSGNAAGPVTTPPPSQEHSNNADMSNLPF